jgi:hypothetical protein
MASPNLQPLKDSVHRLTNHLQSTLGFLELQNYDQAMLSLHTAILGAVELSGLIRDFKETHHELAD